MCVSDRSPLLSVRECKYHRYSSDICVSTLHLPQFLWCEKEDLRQRWYYNWAQQQHLISIYAVKDSLKTSEKMYIWFIHCQNWCSLVFIIVIFFVFVFVFVFVFILVFSLVWLYLFITLIYSDVSKVESQLGCFLWLSDWVTRSPIELFWTVKDRLLSKLKLIHPNQLPMCFPNCVTEDEWELPVKPCGEISLFAWAHELTQDSTQSHRPPPFKVFNLQFVIFRPVC